MDYKFKLTDITNPKTISDYLFLGVINFEFLIEHKDYMPMTNIDSTIQSEHEGLTVICYAGAALSLLFDFEEGKKYKLEDFEYCYDELMAVNLISFGLLSMAVELYKPDSKVKYKELIEELKMYDGDDWYVVHDKNLKLLEIVRLLKKYGL
jgi:hypothetical protein